MSNRSNWIDKHSRVPLYVQAKSLIKDRIDSGLYQPGAQIPTETALCSELGLSRPTVRQAIAELVQEGLLQIERGRGTFVRQEAERQILLGVNAFRFSLLSSHSLDGKHFIDYHSPESIPDEYAAVFAENHSGNERGFFQIDWVEGPTHSPQALCRSYIPRAMFPSLLEDIQRRKRMVEITANRYALLPQQANWRLYQRLSEDHESQLLHIGRSEALFVQEAVFSSRSAHITEMSIALIPAEKTVLQFDSQVFRGQ